MTSIGYATFEGCSEELIIRGQTGSYAQEYAKANNLKFRASDAVKGDVDGDGELAISDVQLALRAALRITTLDTQAAWSADVDGEPRITLNDAFLILEKALKVIEAF